LTEERNPKEGTTYEKIRDCARGEADERLRIASGTERRREGDDRGDAPGGGEIPWRIATDSERRKAAGEASKMEDFFWRLRKKISSA
jgi:hypothetical protein